MLRLRLELGKLKAAASSSHLVCPERGGGKAKNGAEARRDRSRGCL
jgi:hypothetical protein